MTYRTQKVEDAEIFISEDSAAVFKIQGFKPEKLGERRYVLRDITGDYISDVKAFLTHNNNFTQFRHNMSDSILASIGKLVRY